MSDPHVWGQRPQQRPRLPHLASHHGLLHREEVPHPPTQVSMVRVDAGPAVPQGRAQQRGYDGHSPHCGAGRAVGPGRGGPVTQL